MNCCAHDFETTEIGTLLCWQCKREYDQDGALRADHFVLDDLTLPHHIDYVARWCGFGWVVGCNDCDWHAWVITPRAIQRAADAHVCDITEPVYAWVA